MRDWALVLLPIAIAVYFIIYPDQFSELVAGAMQWVR